MNDNRLNKTQARKHPNVYRVDKIARHGGFIYDTWLNDIAIITGVIS